MNKEKIGDAIFKAIMFLASLLCLWLACLVCYFNYWALATIEHNVLMFFVLPIVDIAVVVALLAFAFMWIDE